MELDGTTEDNCRGGKTQLHYKHTHTHMERTTQFSPSFVENMFFVAQMCHGLMDGWSRKDAWDDVAWFVMSHWIWVYPKMFGPLAQGIPICGDQLAMGMVHFGIRSCYGVWGEAIEAVSTQAKNWLSERRKRSAIESGTRDASARRIQDIASEAEPLGKDRGWLADFLIATPEFARRLEGRLVFLIVNPCRISWGTWKGPEKI